MSKRQPPLGTRRPTTTTATAQAPRTFCEEVDGALARANIGPIPKLPLGASDKDRHNARPVLRAELGRRVRHAVIDGLAVALSLNVDYGRQRWDGVNQRG